MKGDLAIPDTVESAILKSWKPTAPAEPLRIEGSHHIEAVLDNRNGDVLAIYAAFMAAQGRDWQAPLKDPQVGSMINGVLPDILDIRAAGDLKDFDNANINLRIDATAEKGPGLEFMIKMIWPNVLEIAAKQGVTIKGDPLWDAQKGALLVDLNISGFKPMLEASIRKVSVTVSYKEGKFDRELLVTQYVTNPQQGQLDPGVMGSGGGSGAGLPGLLGGSTTGSSPLTGGGLLPGILGSGAR